MSGIPCPPIPEPPTATRHCRHYSYELGGMDDMGPRCARGVDNTKPGATNACMPADMPKRGIFAVCNKREEHTEEERLAYENWRVRASVRATETMAAIFAVIPKSGESGFLPCPGCGTGTVAWHRSPRNGHKAIACSTPKCFAMIE